MAWKDRWKEKTFEITYNVVHEGVPYDVTETVTETVTFKGTGQIDARGWAEDYAYSAADKGWYEIEEVKK